MQRLLLFALAAAGLLSTAHAETGTEKKLAPGTSVLVVGQISSPPRGEIKEQKMQVAVGHDRADYTLHFKKAELTGLTGDKIDEDGLDSGQWVRAEGTMMENPRRIRVTRLQVIGEKSMTSLKGTPHFREGQEHGYLVAAEGRPPAERPGRRERRTGRDGQDNAAPTALTDGTPVVVVGQISSPPRGELKEQKTQVTVGPGRVDYTLHFNDATLTGLQGQKIDEDGLDRGHWVRAEGWVMEDPRRIKVSRLQIIVETDVKTLAGTEGFREGFPQGYVMATGEPSVRTGFSSGTQVVLVGQVTSRPQGVLEEKKMQVGVGPDRMDYTLHFRDAALVGLYGQKIDEDGFDNGMWVRAEGRVMEDSRRVRVSRIQVVSKDTPGFRQSAFWRSGYEQGYVTTVAGSRQTFPSPAENAQNLAPGPMTLVGQVTDDTGPLATTRKIQARVAGNEWTLSVAEEAAVLDEKGEKISVHEIDKGQWVRVTGWKTDDLRMRVVRIQSIGAEEAFRKSTFYRAEWPLGYAEQMDGNQTDFVMRTVSGTISARNEDWDYVVVRDEKGREWRVYADTMQVRKDGRHTPIHELHVGDKVTAEGYIFATNPDKPEKK